MAEVAAGFAVRAGVLHAGRVLGGYARYRQRLVMLPAAGGVLAARSKALGKASDGGTDGAHGGLLQVESRSKTLLPVPIRGCMTR